MKSENTHRAFLEEEWTLVWLPELASVIEIFISEE
jgi:hypothetical protein